MAQAMYNMMTITQEPNQEEMDKHAKKESAPYGEPSQQDELADRLSDAYEKGGEEGLCKEAGCTLEELDNEINEICREKGLHPDDDRDECIQLYIEELVDNADYKDHGEYESIEKDEKDSWTGSTKDGHKYKAVADDMEGSQYLKVFYGDGKYFRIYYDSSHIGGKAGGYDHTQVAPETNDPKAKKVFADLPDDFFDKYGSEGETGLEDIIDMIKSVDESLEEAMCGCCGNDPCDCAPDCKGCKSMDEAVDSTVNNALDAAIQELRTLAGLNS